jgi:hypothetical protein
MPADQRLRLDDRQQTTPFDEARQRDKRNPNPRRIVGTPRPDLPFQVRGQLPSQEQVLRRELGT